MDLPDLSALAVPGQQIAVRVTPRASRARLVVEGEAIRVYVTVVPEGGKANAAVERLLAKALGIPRSKLELVRGASARDKLFRVL